ncbi:MAG: TlpA family protein disulfide reductase [Deltaproteobacteria bacterium]|nr:TlpA family protein disulfide reductase [Deltaproteobacteria bacterium]MBW1920028.1 TlpA family protein disulfide reductase [Deltaproteobacteria bacterium]
MKLNHRLRIGVLGFFLAATLMFGCGKKNAKNMAPDFSLQDLSGSTVTLSKARGSIVVLDFWATWCPPCLMSIPELVELQEKYRDSGLVVIGISLDDPGRVSDSDLLAFKEKLKINYKVLRANYDVVKNYFGTENMSIPTMFIIDRKGRILEKHVGFRPGLLEESLRKLLS